MNQRSTEVLDFFDARRTELERASAAVPSELVARRPAPERWSVAEVLAHVAIVERGVLRLLRSAIEAADESTLGAEPELGSVVSTVDVARLLDRTHPVTASPAIQPPRDADASRAWRGLESTRLDLRSLVTEYDGVDLNRVLVANPVLGPINVYQWIVFLGGHEARHAAQIEEARAALA